MFSGLQTILNWKLFRLDCFGFFKIPLILQKSCSGISTKQWTLTCPHNMHIRHLLTFWSYHWKLYEGQSAMLFSIWFLLETALHLLAHWTAQQYDSSTLKSSSPFPDKYNAIQILLHQLKHLTLFETFLKLNGFLQMSISHFLDWSINIAHFVRQIEITFLKLIFLNYFIRSSFLQSICFILAIPSNFHKSPQTFPFQNELFVNWPRKKYLRWKREPGNPTAYPCYPWTLIFAEIRPTRLYDYEQLEASRRRDDWTIKRRELFSPGS